MISHMCAYEAALQVQLCVWPHACFRGQGGFRLSVEAATSLAMVVGGFTAYTSQSWRVSITVDGCMYAALGMARERRRKAPRF